VERLSEELLENAREGVEKTLQRLSHSVLDFAGKQPQHDDITLIALQKLAFPEISHPTITNP